MGGIGNEQYLALVERDSTTNNDEIPDVAGDGDPRGGGVVVGTVGTLHSRHLKDFVFLDLHNNDESVSTRFSTTLQESLSQEMTKEERAKYTSKTWQKSGCTLTAYHPDVSGEKAIVLLGHEESGGGQCSTYVDYCSSL